MSRYRMTSEYPDLFRLTAIRENDRAGKFPHVIEMLGAKLANKEPLSEAEKVILDVSWSQVSDVGESITSFECEREDEIRNPTPTPEEEIIQTLQQSDYALDDDELAAVRHGGRNQSLT